MVMAQLRVRPADALALLRAHAYAHAGPLSQIAADVVARRLDFKVTDGASRVEDRQDGKEEER